jgi:hypothetical protein
MTRKNGRKQTDENQILSSCYRRKMTRTKNDDEKLGTMAEKRIDLNKEVDELCYLSVLMVSSKL